MSDSKQNSHVSGSFEFPIGGSWKKSPDNTELIPNDQLFTYLGSQGPIKMALSDQAALSGPSITGKNGAPEKMSLFANNQASLSCCPSTYSTDQGCVCTTPQQRKFIGEQRGNNKNFPNGSF